MGDIGFDTPHFYGSNRGNDAIDCYAGHVSHLAAALQEKANRYHIFMTLETFFTNFSNTSYSPNHSPLDSNSRSSYRFLSYRFFLFTIVFSLALLYFLL
jgi:hypothetical protein